MPDTRHEDPVDVIAHEGFTSTGGYRYQATEMTRHAGPIARLCVNGSGVVRTSTGHFVGGKPVSLEPGEAAELGLWLLRGVVAHEGDEEVRALLNHRIDALARELSSVLDDER